MGKTYNNITNTTNHLYIIKTNIPPGSEAKN